MRYAISGQKSPEEIARWLLARSSTGYTVTDTLFFEPTKQHPAGRSFRIAITVRRSQSNVSVLQFTHTFHRDGERHIVQTGGKYTDYDLARKAIETEINFAENFELLDQ